MEQNEKKKVNWFVRIMLIIFIVYILFIISVGFFKGEPLYNLTSEYLTLFFLTTILILSESFDNMNLGKILALKRQVNEEKAEVKEVKEENANLREHILKMTLMISQNQHQTNNTINGVTPEMLKLLGVVQAKEDEDNNAVLRTDETETDNTSVDETTSRINNVENGGTNYTRRDFNKFIEKESIDQYISKFNILESNLMRDVQFASSFHELDPIMERKVIFDAYLKTESAEYFYEVMMNVHPGNFDRLYVLLSKISYYSQAKQIKARLILLIPKLPQEIEARHFMRHERVLEVFQPAIANDLLRVEFIEFSMQDVERWETELNKN